MSEPVESPSIWNTPLHNLLRGRVTGPLPKRQNIKSLLAQSDLPVEAVDCVSHVVKATRLWRSEKMEVACELIDHFQQGLETGTKADKLVADFGDVKIAARLIRRAKRRNRPIAWHALVFSSRAALVLPLLYLLVCLWLLTGSPTIQTNYLDPLNEMARSVPEADRAWPIYREALTELDWGNSKSEVRQICRILYLQDEGNSPQEIRDHLKDRFDTGHQTAPDKRVSDFLQRHTATLAKVRRAAARPGLGFVVGGQLDPDDAVVFGYTKEMIDSSARSEPPLVIGVLLEYFHPLQSLSRLLVAEAKQAATEGDADTALANATAILAMARHVDEVPFVINHLVAQATVRMVTRDIVSYVLEQHPELWSDAQLRDLAHLVSAPSLRPSQDLADVRAMFHDLVQRVFTDDGNGDGRFTSEGRQLLPDWAIVDESPKVPLVAELPYLTWNIGSRRELLEKHDRLMDRYVASLAVPAWRNHDESEQLARQMNELRDRLVPGIYGFMENYRHFTDCFEAYHEGAIAGIALELYRRRHGQWPATLDELVPEFLPSVPVDRITGKSVRYVLRDGRPIVYSVGADRDDDGGRPPEEDNLRTSFSAAAKWIAENPHPSVNVPDGDWLLWPQRDFTADFVLSDANASQTDSP